MYGSHNIPLKIEAEGISLELLKEATCAHYKRVCADEQEEKILLAKNATILINPVEPINKPKEITQYLLIEFNKSVIIEPGGRHKIYLTFPIAIGIFLQQYKNFEILDIFTLVKQKYTLYGDPHRGVVCRYWKSPVASTLPAVHPLHEGVIELTIKNTSESWIEVTKAVFNACGMKIFYSDELVSMKAHMTIQNTQNAETAFRDTPLKKPMQKSLELYTARKLSVLSPAFIMTEGI